jgi:DNA transposition AAA+ family ATPase
MDTIKAGMGGATSGFDRLFADTDRMTQEVKRITPPPSCVLYHEASLEALEESRGMLESLKVAITTRNVQALGVIAQQAANLQAKTEALAELQEELRASAR